MASIFERDGRWIAKYKDGHGRWKAVRTKARTKTEAKRLAHELELKAERQRMGLEELPADDGGGTLAELFEWWLDTYVAHISSRERVRSVVRRHLQSSPLAERRLVHVTPAAIEQFLQAKSGELAPQTLNHLRTHIATAFSRAKRAGKWKGSNPALEVPRRKVPKRLPNYLAATEVPLVLEALLEDHRPIFAMAIYTGMRKGEIAGLLKSDIDLVNNLIYVRRSYDRDTTKGGTAAAILVAAELRPFLEVALKRSTSAFVFPGPD
jgi:integrase